MHVDYIKLKIKLFGVTMFLIKQSQEKMQKYIKYFWGPVKCFSWKASQLL